MPYFLTLSASPNKFSKTAFLLRTIARRLDAQGLELRVVHAADLDRSFTSHLLQLYLGDFNQLVRQAEAIILLTPMDTGNDPGLLAPLLDLLPDDAFAGKPVLFVATGGPAERVSELQQTYAAEFQRLQANLLQPPLHIGLRAWIIVGEETGTKQGQGAGARKLRHGTKWGDRSASAFSGSSRPSSGSRAGANRGGDAEASGVRMGLDVKVGRTNHDRLTATRLGVSSLGRPVWFLPLSAP
jgi:NAD(P)H-dependent FMN reductase